MEHLLGQEGKKLKSTSFFGPCVLGSHVKLLPCHPFRIEASVEEKDRGDKH